MTENVKVAVSKKLTPKQARGVAALLSESTITAAAVKAGVTPKTIYKWLLQPGFNTALRDAQAQAIDAAARRLTGGLEKALDIHDRLMMGAVSETVKMRAVSEWEANTLKLRELFDLETRVSELENKLKR